jgi:aspartyl protease family protein
MGTFSVEIQVRPMGASQTALTPVKCLVDTGAAFCQFPRPLVASLGVPPDRHVPVVLADGTRREQPAAWLEVRYGDRVAFTLVLFGSDNGLTLLGAHALEGLGLAVDPVRKVLEPSRFPLA